MTGNLEKSAEIDRRTEYWQENGENQQELTGEQETEVEMKGNREKSAEIDKRIGRRG
jgi:hypothetical protein